MKTDARERATLLLFEAETKNQPVSLTLSELDVQPDTYTVELLNDFVVHEDHIEDLISDNTKNWTKDRLPAFDRAAMRMAITELVRSADVPVGTIISETVKLCEKYSTDESPRFVNGVLGTIAHKVRGVEMLKKSDGTEI